MDEADAKASADELEDGTDCPAPSIKVPSAGPAASITTRARTQDVISDAASFRELMVSEPLIRSLAASGFERPSPVQKAAIPLGRAGTDLIVQAKSGTGKTVVFAVICLERVKADSSSTQALILSPTREIAIQSEQVIRALAAELPAPAPTSAVFVGGLPIVDDEKRLRRLCHIAVGTPGRVGALLQSGRLPPERLGLLVLDEADSLLGDSFYQDVAWIYDQLPKRKQVLAFSATYTAELLADLEPLMRRPQRIMMCSETVTLLGVRQFYALVPVAAEGGKGQQHAAGGLEGDEQLPAAAGSGPAVFRRKTQELLRLLTSVSFHQAAVFCNHKPRAQWLAEQLAAAGYPAAYLAGDRAQEERMQAMQAVRGFKLRVVVSTDVMARGVDLERVNLVVNMDLPYDAATYCHRVGRTGRFGSRGVCVSYVTPAELALLVSYVDEQAATTAAATAAAAAAATTNGGGGETPPAASRESASENGGCATNAGAVAAAPPSDADPLLLPLPEIIPEDLYGYELGNEWERRALQELLARERQARQRQLAAAQGDGAEGGSSGSTVGGGVTAEGNTAVEGEGGSTAEGTASLGGEVRGVGGGGVGGRQAAGQEGGLGALPELPPLPEEVAAAKKAEKAAAGQARKAEAAAQQRQTDTQQAAAAEATSTQELEAQWAAYYAYYGGYGNGHNGGGYGGNGYTASYPADGSAWGSRPTAPTTGPQPWSAHSADYHRRWSHHHHAPPFTHAAPHAYPGNYWSHPSYSAPQSSHQSAEAVAPGSSAPSDAQDTATAWAQYYSQWQQQQYQHPYGAYWTADASGEARAKQPQAQQQPQQQQQHRAWGAAAAAVKGEAEEEDGSELSFNALRGKMVGGREVPAVLLADVRRNRRGAGSGAAAAAAGGTMGAGAGHTGSASEAGLGDEEELEEGELSAVEEGEDVEEGGEDEEAEDDLGLAAGGDLAGQAARLVDRLQVLLPAGDKNDRTHGGSAAARPGSAGEKAAAAAVAACTTAKPPGTAAAGADDGTASAAAAGAGVSGDTSTRWDPYGYGYSYDPYGTYGASGSYCQPGSSYQTAGHHHPSGGPYGSGSSHNGAGAGSGHPPYGWSAPPHAHSYGRDPYGYYTQQWWHAPPPPHHHHYLYHCQQPYHYPPHHPPHPGPGHHGYGPYGGPAHPPAPYHPHHHPWDRSNTAGWGSGGAPGGDPWRMQELRRELEGFVRQQATWLQAYDTWREQYRLWYEECQRQMEGSAAEGCGGQ